MQVAEWRSRVAELQWGGVRRDAELQCYRQTKVESFRITELQCRVTELKGIQGSGRCGDTKLKRAAPFHLFLHGALDAGEWGGRDAEMLRAQRCRVGHGVQR